jgi:phage terminase large subunit-like protein
MSTLETHGKRSEIESLSSLPERQWNQVIDSLSLEECQALLYNWKANARPNQQEPTHRNWSYWLILAGRGFGKTRTGAETIRSYVERYSIIHLVGATAADVRDVMVDGESGLRNCFPPHQPIDYEPSKRLITFHTGAIARLFSADEPERLRGPQCEAFWADEIAAWNYAQEAWDNLLFGFRLGNDPRGIITTTPKPIKLLKEIIADPDTVITRGSSYENRSNLAPKFFNSIIRKYEGTRLGRQELMAELLEDVPGALWTQELIDRHKVRTYPQPFLRIVIPIDPAVSTGENSSETGIGVVGLGKDGHIYVLEDLSGKYAPMEWARIAIEALKRWRADLIVGEVNNGGDLVEANLRAVNPNIPFRQVRASRGKLRRAEPVANLYEQGRVHHVISASDPTNLQQLESQQCSYVAGMDQDSPDRMDALVWGVTELLIDVEQSVSSQPIVSRVQISRF